MTQRCVSNLPIKNCEPTISEAIEPLDKTFINIIYE